MKERLVIKNFGPIKSVDLELGKMTILIGEQATGKSTIAKVLAVCRYFSYIVNYKIDFSEYDKFTSNENFYHGLEDWDLIEFLSEKSEIIYQNDLYKFEFKNNTQEVVENVSNGIEYKIEYFDTRTKLSNFSNDFKILLLELQELRNIELKKNYIANISNRWSPNENFYRLNVKKLMNNPLFIPTERVLQSISFSNSMLTSESIQNELSKLNKIVRGYNIEMTIEPLELSYKNNSGFGYTKKQGEEKYNLLHNGASGYQSTIPIVLAIKFYKHIRRTFIIEEPELNLFPKAQKKLMEFFVENINNNGHSFLLPTHSPYILSSIENLMYAYKLGNIENGIHKEKVHSIVDKNHWINPDEVSVYYLNNGDAKNILDRKEALIDKEYIDSVSKIINDEFDQLLNIEVEYEH